MSTAPSPNPNGNPFDVPLDSEIQESQQRQAATPAKDTGYVNPFDEPLASRLQSRSTQKQPRPTLRKRQAKHVRCWLAASPVCQLPT